MTANCSAHRLRIFVGEDQQDWSRSLVSFDAGYDKRSLSGLIFTTATLELGRIPNAPDSMNPRSPAGRQRWHRGQIVQVEVTDSNGTWVRHPFGWLYLLETPESPTPDSPTLKLDLGCILSLRDFAQPDDDKSDVTPGTERTRQQIINSLLTAAGCPSLLDPVPLYPIDTPQPKQGGSFVGQAGQIAAGGLVSLYQDNQGQIRAADNRLNLDSPIATLHIPGDEIGYSPSRGSETPVELLKCVGVKKSLVSNYGTQESHEEQYGPASLIDPNATGIIMTRSIQTTEEIDASGRKRTEVVRAPAGLVDPVTFPASLDIVLDSFTQEEHSYTNTRLSRISSSLRRLYPVALPQWYQALSPAQKNAVQKQIITAQRTVTAYDYTSRETVQGITVSTSEPLGAIVPEEPIDTPTALRTVQVETTKWIRRSSRIGKRVDQTREATIRAFPALSIQGTPDERIQAKTALLTTRTKTTFSASGQANPPATERHIEPFTESESPLEGKVQFQLAPVTTAHQERERTISLDAGVVSQEQLETIAQIEGVLLIGRDQGQTIQIPLLDVFLTNPSPFLQLNIVEPDGTTITYLSDAIQISHDPTQAIWGCEAIWLASAEGNTPPQPPYESVSTPSPLVIPTPPIVLQSLQIGLKLGFQVQAFDYPLTQETASLTLGLRLGFNVIEVLPFTLLLGFIVQELTAPPSGGPIAHFPLDADPWLDAMSSLALTGDGFVTSVSGVISNAASFGQFSYLEWLHDDRLKVGNHTWRVTFHLWVDSQSQTTTRIIGQSETLLSDWVLMFNSFQCLELYIDDSLGTAAYVEAFALPISRNTWHFIECGYNSTTQVAFISVDGERTEEIADRAPADVRPDSRFRLGAHGPGGPSFIGLLDDIKFYREV